MTNEMTDEQLRRQDLVDNAVFCLIQKTNLTNKRIDWDIEMIGNIRDALVHELEKKFGINEFEIYP